MSSFFNPQQKLARICSRKKKLWVVSYVNQTGQSPLSDEAISDVDASLEGGADAVILINEWSNLTELENTLAHVRRRFPMVPLGVNFLGDEHDSYGYIHSFRLAKEYNLAVVWTDFSGVDLIQEKPPVNLHDIEQARASAPGTFYCSGVHMKYSTLLDASKTIEQSALQAMGWVDGVIVTGPKTGVSCDPRVVARARGVLGNYPLGVASGVSAENVGEIGQHLDFFLVASSLQNDAKRIVGKKVHALRLALDSLG